MPNDIADLTQFAPTLLKAMGIAPLPHMSPACGPLEAQLRALAGGDVTRAAIFHADAVPAYVIRRHPALFAPVRRMSRLEVPFRAVMPSITPVCFAAMYSGAYPDRNGVPRYLPPVLTSECIQPRISCETVIEALVRAGRRVAVITCSNGCIASMLYGRGAEMRIIDGDDDAAMFESAMDALRAGTFDVVFLYQLSYDYTMHERGPESPEALDVLRTLGERYERFAGAAVEAWRGERVLTVFNADHGAHRVEKAPDHQGAHGEDIPEDMEMTWFFGIHSPAGMRRHLRCSKPRVKGLCASDIAAREGTYTFDASANPGA